jgi:hypothetical protein
VFPIALPYFHSMLFLKRSRSPFAIIITLSVINIKFYLSHYFFNIQIMFLIAKIPSLAIKLRAGSGYPEWAREIEPYLLNFHIHDIITTAKSRRELPTDTPRTILNSPSQWDEANTSALLLMINNTEGLARSMIVMK